MKERTFAPIPKTHITHISFYFTFKDSFYDFTKSTNLEVDASAKLSYSFGYSWFNGEISAQRASETTTTSKTHYVASSMRIERYYASIREEMSSLTDDATTLLNREDYVGFFKACGPSYIRGIRRAQEVNAFFLFTSSSSIRSTEYADSVQVSHWWWTRRNGSRSSSRSSTTKSESQSLRIIIKGFGLGLSQDGSETLIAQNLEEYNGVMKFAFRTMTKIPESHHIGMVYGMEVVPWVENIVFQVAANLQDESIEIPVARSLIPRAFRISDPKDFNFINDSDETRAQFRCKAPQFEIDKYGYCCESGSLYDTKSQEYAEENPRERVCRPLRSLEPSFIKDNLAANGEFVARLDRSVRYKLNQLSTLERCISAARAIPERYDYYILKSQDQVKFDGTIDINFSVFELKMALDPFNDYGMLKHMAKELDEFLDMYIAPCYAAIFGSNVGTSPDTDASFFMAYPWHNHDECTKLSCLGTSMRWDRSNPEGGCVSSLIAGVDSPNFSGGEDNCNKDANQNTLHCKHKSSELEETHAKTTGCWNKIVPRGRVDYFMDHFCMPSLSGAILNQGAINALRASYVRFCGGTGERKSMNVALSRPTEQTDEAAGGVHGRAVDGNTDGNYWRRSVTHTSSTTDPYWQVDLEGSFEIVEVVVYNREDCCENRLDNFVLTITDGTNITPTFTYTHRGRAQHETRIKVPTNTNGSKVKIQLFGTNRVLSLAEVEVYNIYYS